MDSIYRALETSQDVQGEVMAEVLMDDTIQTREMYGDLAELYRRASFEERKMIDKTLNILIERNLEELADEIIKTAAETEDAAA